jgi:hypothetical protein
MCSSDFGRRERRGRPTAPIARAPWYVIRKAFTVHRLVKFDADTWVRTDRGAHEMQSRM